MTICSTSVEEAEAVPGNLCEGRLTLLTGVSAPSTDVTSSTNVFFTPHNGGDRIHIFNGTKPALYTFTQRTLALGTVTNNLINDVFIFDNAGTLELEKVAWTTNAARATDIAAQNGAWYKVGSPTKRYLGSFLPISTTTTADFGFPASGLPAKRCLWNVHNRVERPWLCIETSDSWNYSTASFRAWNDNANELLTLTGIAGAQIVVDFLAMCKSTTATAASVGIGVGSTTVNSAQIMTTQVAANILLPCLAHYSGFMALGRQTYSALERGAGSGTQTFYGDVGTTYLQAGMKGSVLA